MRNGVLGRGEGEGQGRKSFREVGQEDRTGGSRPEKGMTADAKHRGAAGQSVFRSRAGSQEKGMGRRQKPDKSAGKKERETGKPRRSPGHRMRHIDWGRATPDREPGRGSKERAKRGEKVFCNEKTPRQPTELKPSKN